MSDVFSKAKRSQVMSCIRGHGNRDTELALVKILRTYGITGWRRKLPVFGKPDFVFPAAHIAVFVDGCFWHGCPQHGTRPRQNRKFWDAKIARNRQRDREVTRMLRRKSWKVVRFWEHELRSPAAVMRRIKAALRTSNSQRKSPAFLRRKSICHDEV